MKVAEQIRKTIESIPESQPFGYADLGIEPANFVTGAKALERLQKKGVIKKVSKGVFYIPRRTVFGELGPDSNGILKRYLFEDGRRVAYETSYSLYNSLGLTTQMAFRIKVATTKNRFKINQGSLQVSSVKSYVEVTDDNYVLLGYLDALKDIRRIPDCSTLQAIKRMSVLIKALSAKEQKEIIEYALFYPARTRALLGAILENLDVKTNLSVLKNSLNPLTKITLNIKENDLRSIKNWNIE
jgi:predicted transcriptional regulator of viral defense system